MVRDENSTHLQRTRAVEESSDRAAVAYVLKGFPRLSETFIANEIHRLETLGMRLRLYSVKPGEKGTPHAVVERIAAPLVTLPPAASIADRSLVGWLAEHLPRFAAAHVALAGRRPLAYARTFAAVVAMTRRYRGVDGRARKVFVKEFLQAGVIARDVLRSGDVHHLHGHFAHGATTITWYAAQLTGLPFSFTAHAKDIYQAKLNPGDLLERKLGAARFVATCTGVNAAYLRARAPRPETVRTIYHGLDSHLFRPQPGAAARAAPPVILSVGRFVAKKGFATLVEACAELHARGVDFRCVLLGERDDDYARIETLVARLGLAAVIELHEPVAQEALVAHYARASVFVLPCQVMADGDRDGIPNVLVEAMAMGLPVISTDVSGIPELIDNGVDGLLVPPRSSANLAAALALVLESAPLRARLGAAARAKVLERFDAARTTRALAELFDASLAAEAGARSVPPDVETRPLVRYSVAAGHRNLQQADGRQVRTTRRCEHDDRSEAAS